MNIWPFKKKEEPVEEDLILEEPYDVAGEARANIDTVIAVYNFIDEIDLSSPDLLRWNMKRKVLRAKRQCLHILCASIEVLQAEEEEGEEDD
jgi:hypothetical protein